MPAAAALWSCWSALDNHVGGIDGRNLHQSASHEGAKADLDFVGDLQVPEYQDGIECQYDIAKCRPSCSVSAQRSRVQEEP